jgi:GNAT superfamily N-acetyltransferase
VDIALRRVTEADVVRLQQLSRRTFSETFEESNSPEDLRAYLEDRLSLEKLILELRSTESRFMVAESASTPVGYAKLNWGGAQTEPRGAASVELERLYVVRDFKGRGVGSLLMDWSVREARSMGAQELWLGVWEHNHDARAFYARYGFEQVGSHVFRLGGDDQTDLILAKSLIEYAPQN